LNPNQPRIDLDRVIALCRKALKDNPDNATAHHDLGVALMEKRDFTNALTHLERAAELAPKHVLTHYLLGIARAEKMALDEAIESWKRMLELDRRNSKKLNGMAHYFIGKVYGLKGMWDAALMEFNRAKKYMANNPLLLSAEAEIHLAKGELEEAKRQWLATAKLTPDDPRAALNVCAIALDTADYRLALEYGQRVLALGQDNAAVRFNLGLAHLRLGDYDAAIQQLETAVRLDAADVSARLNLGEAYVRKGLIDEGVRQWEEVASDQPNSPEPLYNIGLAYAQSGLSQRALEYWQKGLERDPDYLPIYMARAANYAERDQFSESMADWQKVLELDPESTIARINLMIIHIRQGDYQAALDVPQTEDQEQPDLRFLQALCRLKLGEEEAALKELAQVLEVDPEVSGRYVALVQSCLDPAELADLETEHQAALQALSDLLEADPEAEPPSPAAPPAAEEKGLWASLLKALRR
jgi:tetratricopeptide (TPR) repeat protein